MTSMMVEEYISNANRLLNTEKEGKYDWYCTWLTIFGY